MAATVQTVEDNAAGVADGCSPSNIICRSSQHECLHNRRYSPPVLDRFCANNAFYIFRTILPMHEYVLTKRHHEARAGDVPTYPIPITKQPIRPALRGAVVESVRLGWNRTFLLRLTLCPSSCSLRNVIKPEGRTSRKGARPMYVCRACLVQESPQRSYGGSFRPK